MVLAVVISPDGQKAVSASSDNTLKLWDLNSGEPVRTLTGHTRAVLAVAITPDGQKAVFASRENTLKIWDLNIGKEMATFTGDGLLYCCAVAPDGVTVAAGDQFGRVHFLRLEGGATGI
jgi:WD40 repeat protein